MQLYDYTINYHHGEPSRFVGGVTEKSKSAFHIDAEGCDVIVPFKWCSGAVAER